MNTDTPANDEFHILSYNVGELSEGVHELKSLNDPRGYLREIDQGLVQLMQDCPLSAPDHLALLVACQGRVVVGRVGLVPGRVRIGGVDDLVFCIRGFFLDAEVRHTGIGGLMLMALLKHSRQLMASGGPRPEAREVYEAAGFVELERLRRYFAFLDGSVPGEKFFGRFGRIGGRLATPFLRAAYATSRAISNMRFEQPSLEFQPVKQFEETLDAIFHAKENFCFPRTVSELNWVLRHRPRVQAFTVSKSGSPVGYCLIKIDNHLSGSAPHSLSPVRVVNLHDHWIADLSKVDAWSLVTHILNFARASSAQVIEVQSADHYLNANLRGLGFFHFGGNYIYFRAKNRNFAPSAASWRFSHGVSDVILT